MSAVFTAAGPELVTLPASEQFMSSTMNADFNSFSERRPFVVKWFSLVMAGGALV